MKRARLSWLLLPALLLAFQAHIFSQTTANCAECPISFDDAVVGILTHQIDVPPVGANDLSVNPLERVCFNISHSWLGDLFIVLESPGGKTYFLMGDDDNNAGGCGSPASNVNICFVPGTDNPLTTGESYAQYCNGGVSNCLIGDWTLACGPAMISNLLPGPIASPTCDLNDFNAPGDPVGGNWTAYFGCVCGAGESAQVNNWSLTFANGSVAPCPGPATTSASFGGQPCNGDNLVLNASGGQSYLWEGPSGFTANQPTLLLPGFGNPLAGEYTCTIVTTEGCTEQHSLLVENVCEKQDLSLALELSKTYCFTEIQSTGHCTGVSNGTLQLEMDGNCITLTALGPGIDSVFVWEKIGDDEIYHRFVVDIPQPEYTWPGDLNSDGTVNHLDPLYLGLAYGQTGYPRQVSLTEWSAQYAPDWDISTPNTTVNLKHMDADGNGEIGMTDLAMSIWNWGKTHAEATNPGIDYLPAGHGTAPRLWLAMPALEAGQTYHLPLYLGTAALPAANVNGLAFRIVVDDVVMSYDAFQIQLDGSLLGEANVDWAYLTRIQPDGIFVGLTRLGNAPINGHGQIGTLTIEVPADLPTGTQLALEILPDLCLNGDEQPCALSASTQTSSVVNAAAERFPSDWSLSPNPTSGQVVLATPNVQVSTIQVFDATGVLRQEVLPQAETTRFDLSDWANGLYLVRVEVNDKMYFQRISLVR